MPDPEESLENPPAGAEEIAEKPLANPDDPHLEALLQYLKQSRGFDFTGYKRTSLMRRILKRMENVSIASYEQYVDYLEVYPDEFAQLFDTILINVTAFFRDTSAWDYIVNEAVPRMVKMKREGDAIRVWSAGCASGEEAYTLAMVLAEALGVQPVCERVKIYATDVDEHALTKARHAMYTAREVEGVPAPLLDKYFERVNHSFLFSKDLRRSVIFGRHNLIQDAPISRIDLLVCRNTLMYFNTETQARILARFHYALCEHGYLFLGKAETLMAYSNAFSPVDLKRRIFMKVQQGVSRDRMLTSLVPNGNGEDPSLLVGHLRVRETAFDASPVAQIVLDANNVLALANERARSLFGLTPDDLGRSFQDLSLSYRPIELRSLIDRVLNERMPFNVRDVEWKSPGGEVLTLEVTITPLVMGQTKLLGISIAFNDVTNAKRLQKQLQQTHHDLETAYEEVQSTNEELETTNEELQSTVEELETTNEELQSTNEELETMNEELQSTNEELETSNAELGERTVELNEVNNFLESILSSMRSGVIVVDSDFLIRIWNYRAEDFWGLRSDEVHGKNLLTLDIGLPVQELRKPIQECLSARDGAQEIALEAMNRRGQRFRCRISCSPLTSKAELRPGAVVLLDDDGPLRETK